jgi:hypothetical protein
MQVLLRCLLALALSAWVASCSLNNHGLANGDAGRPGFDSGANPQGVAGATGAGAAGSTGGTVPTPTGTGGTNVTPTAGTTGGAPVVPAGVGGAAGDASSTGAAGAGAAGSASGVAGAGARGGAAGGGAAGSSSLGGAAGLSGPGGAGGTSSGIISVAGCSDDTREGYLDTKKYPKVAACAGGWETPGLLSEGSRTPQCDRRAGNDGDFPDGRGCSVADLCAVGWHVCESAHALSAVPGGCTDAVAPFGDKPVFFVTRQRATGLICTASNPGSNNLYGCGNIGSDPDKSCDPLTRLMRDSDCQSQSPWSCASGPIGTSQTEFEVVSKSGPNRGGVLCCAD